MSKQRNKFCWYFKEVLRNPSMLSIEQNILTINFCLLGTNACRQCGIYFGELILCMKEIGTHGQTKNCCVHSNCKRHCEKCHLEFLGYFDCLLRKNRTDVLKISLFLMVSGTWMLYISLILCIWSEEGPTFDY